MLLALMISPRTNLCSPPWLVELEKSGSKKEIYLFIVGEIGIHGGDALGRKSPSTMGRRKKELFGRQVAGKSFVIFEGSIHGHWEATLGRG